MQKRASTLIALVLGCSGLAILAGASWRTRSTPPRPSRSGRASTADRPAAPDPLDRLPVCWRALPRRRVSDRREARVRQPDSTLRVRLGRTRRGHGKGQHRLPRHVVALAGEARVHRARARTRREQEHDGDQDGDGPGAAGEGSTGPARRIVAARPRDCCAARPEHAVQGDHGPSGSVPAHDRPALHPDERPGLRGHVKVDYAARPATITIRGPVWTGDPPKAACASRGARRRPTRGRERRHAHAHAVGQGDACKQRGAIITGQWTRVK